MRFSKLSQFLAPAFSVALAFPSLSAAAQSLHVPFNFQVAGKTLPAGDYQLRRDSNGHFVTLVSRDHANSYTFVLHPGTYGEHAAALRFDQNGSTHQLNSIVVGDKATSRLDKSEASKRGYDRGE